MDNRFIHMVPLLLFTVLATVSSGLVIGAAVLMLGGEELLPIHRELLLISFIPALVGTLFSLFHLGHKERFLRAILGTPHSWLSREVVLAGMLVASTGGGYWLMVTGGIPYIIMSVVGIAALSGIFLTWTIGMVYHLPGRSTWRGLAAAVSPLVTALLAAAYLPVLLTGDSHYKKIFFVVWGIDAAASLVRSYTFMRVHRERGVFLFPRLVPVVAGGHLLRSVLLAGAGVSAVFSVHVLVSVFVVLNIAIDRFCLYAGTVEVSPAVEVAILKTERMEEAVM